jgi:hypothetical protein
VLRWIGGRNMSLSSPPNEAILEAPSPSKSDRGSMALKFSEREMDMLVSALRVAEVRRGWVLQARRNSSIDSLSAEDVTDLRHRIEHALRSL